MNFLIKTKLLDRLYNNNISRQWPEQLSRPSNESHSCGWHNNNNVAAHVKKDSSLMNFSDQRNCWTNLLRMESSKYNNRTAKHFGVCNLSYDWQIIRIQKKQQKIRSAQFGRLMIFFLFLSLLSNSIHIIYANK